MGEARFQVPVRKRALERRVNRFLAGKGQRLRRPRGACGQASVGPYYLLDLNKNLMLEKNVELEEFGRRIGAMKDWEVLADE